MCSCSCGALACQSGSGRVTPCTYTTCVTFVIMCVIMCLLQALRDAGYINVFNDKCNNV